ncbi:MAG: hypothetical protein ACM3KR_02040 [Deltaproteobacteria bacterium]
MKKNQIFTRNIIYFYISFFSAGAVNIIPQLFYNRYYPEQKGLLLSITLILSSLAAIFGIVVSGKLLGKVNRSIFSMFWVFVFGFCFSIFTQNAILFIIMIVFASFACNFIYNYSDHFFLNGTPHDSLEQHIKAVLIYQMLGYMLSPIFFSVFGYKQMLSIGIVLLMALIIAYLSFPYVKLGFQTVKESKADVFVREDKSLSCREILFVAYSLSFMMVEMIALSSMVYILSDYYKLTDFGVKSGIVMLEILILSGLTVVLMRPNKKLIDVKSSIENEFLLFNPWINLFSVILFMVTVIMLALRLDNSFQYIMLAVAPAGPAYGLFLKISRSYASNIDMKNGRTILLSVYNNIQNISGAVGYCIVLLCWLIANYYKLDYLKLTIAAIFSMLIVSIILIALWVVSLKREKAKLSI